MEEKKKCLSEDCDRDSYARNYCHKHYTRFRRAGMFEEEEGEEEEQVPDPTLLTIAQALSLPTERERVDALLVLKAKGGFTNED